MSEGMTLEKLRDRLRELANRDQPILLLSETLARWADIADAHLSQPAQAVDVGAIREVIEQTRPYYEFTDNYRNVPTMERALSDVHEKLTHAISGEKAGRVDGWKAPDGFAVALFNATEAYERTRDQFKGKHRKTHAAQVHLLRRAFAELLPASPTPDKEGE